ncbi:gephyrin-like molybdotransferase receptor GlpR [Streptacidiphilus sp. N1-3]|uniref:Gephyrin-like molybdotransferase receptor GlpR n=1 Tax=Streptacidiphilus alkalitolerans TaxID=3342712 RepID=A0ABV6XAC3_9ACTN
MSSSGLIYAVIVGAWAAYLVPMWLRRQDELNEARPTERFSTAIRLLSGRAAMERKVSRGIEDDSAPAQQAAQAQSAQSAQSRAPLADDAGAIPAPSRERSAAAAGAVDGPGAAARPAAASSGPGASVGVDKPAGASGPGPSGVGSGTGQASNNGRHPDPRRRATLLARRRRMVILLFAVFTLGMIAAAVGGIGLLWVPAIPAVLFSVYIGHLRRQERRRFEVKLDRRRAAEAAQRLRERERERRRAAAAPDTAAAPAPAPATRPSAARPSANRPPATRPPDFAHPAGRTAAGSGVHHVQALVEAADSDDADDGDDDAVEPGGGWNSGPGERPADPDAESWDPVPVPLPTYVTAPVAPRSPGGGLDRGAPETWSPGRSSAVPPPAPTAKPRRPPATPLFDQYADDTAPHPRAANE